MHTNKKDINVVILGTTNFNISLSELKDNLNFKELISSSKIDVLILFAADEIDFMIAKGKDLDDGRYVIGARLVEKKGNEVAFIV